jgi:DNA-binding response OmpR family regulator
MDCKKILIVEDDADTCDVYNCLLKNQNYDTFFAGDALSAVIETRKLVPDLIILDLGLPAVDGFFVLERFRANPDLAEIPVLVVSARDRDLNKERALTLGANAYVQKPWNNKALLAIISQLLSQPGLSGFEPKLSGF